MTIGTATVARTKVRSTGERVWSQSPSARLITVRLGDRLGYCSDGTGKPLCVVGHRHPT